MPALAGKVALITGGSSGIGRAAVERFAAEGARVLVVDVAVEDGQAAASSVGGRFLEADVGRSDDWTRIAEAALEHFGGLDVAFLNAGVGTGEDDIRAITDKQYRRILSVNVDGVVFGVRAVVPLMEKRGGGSIVITSSLAGLSGGSDPIYALTKAAHLGFMRDLAPRLAPLGITINALLPNVVDTPLVPAYIREALRQANALMMPPSHVADAALVAIASGDTGQSWICHPQGPPERYEFSPIPERR